MRWIGVLVVAVVGVLMSACGSDTIAAGSGVAVSDLVGTWTVDQIFTESYPDGVIDASWEDHPSVTFSIPARVLGSTACGDYSAGFTLEGEALTLDGMVHYGVECSDDRDLRRERLLVMWQAGEVQVDMAPNGQSMTLTFPRGHAELTKQEG